MKLHGHPHWVGLSCGVLARVDAGVSSAPRLTGMRTADCLFGIEGSFPDISCPGDRCETDIRIESCLEDIAMAQ